MQLEKTEKSVTDTTLSIKPEKHLKEDFPWIHLASLAMFNLLGDWELKSLQEELKVIK